MNDQPNILLIMTDQLSAPFLSFHGGPAKTPNIDQLAASGVNFTSTYSHSPLCAPARFAMMSGQLNSKICGFDNASEFPSSIPTFAHYLRAAGYQTRLVGKMHFVGPDQLHGFEDRLTTDIYPADFGRTPNWGARMVGSTGGFTTWIRWCMPAWPTCPTNSTMTTTSPITRFVSGVTSRGDRRPTTMDDDSVVHALARSVRCSAAVLGSLHRRRDPHAGGQGPS